MKPKPHLALHREGAGVEGGGEYRGEHRDAADPPLHVRRRARVHRFSTHDAHHVQDRVQDSLDVGRHDVAALADAPHDGVRGPQDDGQPRERPEGALGALGRASGELRDEEVQDGQESEAPAAGGGISMGGGGSIFSLSLRE